MKVILNEKAVILGNLTVGRSYEVVIEKNDKVMVLDNQKNQYWIGKQFYEIISQPIEVVDNIKEELIVGDEIEGKVEEVELGDITSKRKSRNNRKKSKLNAKISDNESIGEVDCNTGRDTEETVTQDVGDGRELD